MGVLGCDLRDRFKILVLHVSNRDVSLNVCIYVGTCREGVAPGSLHIKRMLFGLRRLAGSCTGSRIIFFKKPAQLSCTFDLAAHHGCVCVL